VCAQYSDEAPLAKSTYVALVLRLLLDEQGRLIRGELVEDNKAGLWKFVGWTGLINGLQAWFAEQERKMTENR